MDIEQLAALGEILGGIGVLGTLIFLAIEVRHSSKILQINAQSLGMQSFATFNEILATDPELVSLVDRVMGGGEAYSTLTPAEKIRFSVAIRALLMRFEAQFFQYKGGLIDELYWQTRMRWLKGYLSIPTLENWWEMESASALLTNEFVDYVNAVDEKVTIGRFGQVDVGG